MLELNHSFPCPFCSAEITLAIDLSAGDRQQFVYDCETCCSPISCFVELADGKVISFSAEQES